MTWEGLGEYEINLEHGRKGLYGWDLDFVGGTQRLRVGLIQCRMTYRIQEDFTGYERDFQGVGGVQRIQEDLKDTRGFGRDLSR